MQLLWKIFYPVFIYMLINTAMVTVCTTADPLLVSLLSALLAIPILAYFFLQDQKFRGRTVAAASLPIGAGIVIVVSGMVLCVLVNALLEISRLAELFPGYHQAMEQLYIPSLGMQTVAAGIVIPVVEELMFRGLGFSRIRDSKGFFLSAFVSSLFFAIYHGNVVQGVYAFLLGMVMCFFYERYKTILAPILFHIVANLTSIYITAIFGI